MKRIMIIGCPGSGKSTLSKQLAMKLKLPLVHLDQIYWKNSFLSVRFPPKCPKKGIVCLSRKRSFPEIAMVHFPNTVPHISTERNHFPLNMVIFDETHKTPACSYRQGFETRLQIQQADGILPGNLLEDRLGQLAGFAPAQQQRNHVYGRVQAAEVGTEAAAILELGEEGSCKVLVPQGESYIQQHPPADVCSRGCCFISWDRVC